MHNTFNYKILQKLKKRFKRTNKKSKLKKSRTKNRSIQYWINREENKEKIAHENELRIIENTKNEEIFWNIYGSYYGYNVWLKQIGLIYILIELYIVAFNLFLLYYKQQTN